MENTNIEKIIYKDEEIARVIRHHKIENLEFCTDDSSFMQVGIHDKKTGALVKPHAHKKAVIEVTRMEEVFYIVKGKVEVTIYNQDNGEIIQQVILKRGDTMVHYSQGHGLKFLAPTILFEVKQGPFMGTTQSKIYFD